MKINEVSKKLKIPSSTLRYYESLGLIQSSRLVNEYRDYSEKELACIEFVVDMTNMGFTLKEIKALIGLRGNSDDECREFSAAAKEARLRIDKTIASLIGYREKLQAASECCTPQSSVCEFLI